MVTLYSIMLLSLIAHLRQEYPKVLQPWFTNDGAMDGEGSQVTAYFMDLNRVGPMCGYYPGVQKLNVVCPLKSKVQLKEIFLEHDFPVT